MKRESRYNAYGGQSIWLIRASIMLTVLCCCGCATSRKTTETKSLEERMMAVYSHTLPEVTAKIALPIEQLKALPEGVKVEQGKDRAKASIMRQGDTLVVYATCDSLQRLVNFYQSKVEKDATEEKTKVDAPRGMNVTSLLLTLVLLIALLSLARK